MLSVSNDDIAYKIFKINERGNPGFNNVGITNYDSNMGDNVGDIKEKNFKDME